MNFFYALSKTDPIIVDKCNNRTSMHQKGMGLFVLITSLFAFASSYYALSTVFGEWNEFTQSYYLPGKSKVVVGLCSLLYAMMIGLIDREIVSAKSKTAAILRIPLAITIGIVVAVPVKLKVLEKRINQEIHEELVSKINPFLDQKNAFLSSSDDEIAQLELQVDYYTKLKNDEQKRMEAEDIGLLGSGYSGIAGQGKRYNYAQTNADNYTSVIQDLKKRINEKEEAKEERLTSMQQDFELVKPGVAYDFWSKFEAMHRIIEKDETNQSKMMVWGLSLLFILLELTPSLNKLLTTDNEYDMICKHLDNRIKQRLQNIEDDDDPNMFITVPEIKVA